MQKKETDSAAVARVIDMVKVDVPGWINNMSIEELESFSDTVQIKKCIAFTDTATRSFAKSLPMMKDLEDHIALQT